MKKKPTASEVESYYLGFGWNATRIQRVIKRYPKLSLPDKLRIFIEAHCARKVLPLHPVIGSMERKLALELRLALEEILGDRSGPEFWALNFHNAGGTSNLPGGIPVARPDRSDHNRLAYSARLLERMGEREGFKVKAAAINAARRRLGLNAT